MIPVFKSTFKRIYAYRATLLFLGVFSIALWTQVLFEPAKRERFEDGMQALEQKNNEDAVRIFSAILAANPQDAGARLGLAMAYEGLGSLDNALQQLEQSAKAAEDVLVKSYLRSGSISERAGRKAEAKRFFQNALKINPRLESLQQRR